MSPGSPPRCNRDDAKDAGGALWGIRLGVHLFARNAGIGEAPAVTGAIVIADCGATAY